MPLLFAITLFVSATLLFLVQPMVAKMILPLLGGTPAVWNTCMVFFQAALLAGYAYAHATTAWLGVRRQVLFHSVLVFVPFVVLPISIKGWQPPSEANPIPWVLLLLAVQVGLPFLVLSATAPLLQKWFASTGHPSAKDPYFLYAASNLGSMLALLSYPVAIEPGLPLKPGQWLSQSTLWAVGYGLFIFLLVGCAWVVWHSSKVMTKEEGAIDQPGPSGDDSFIDSHPSLLTKLRWVALAFVPSSLMLGVTTHITLDIAAIPLLWVIPLALYLLSFILVFAKWPLALHKGMVLAMPLLVLLVLFMNLSEIKGRMFIVILLDLLTLLVVALVCHGELARTRPSTRYLTEFYLLMSLGGVLGGMFNALLAPLIFSSTVEYQLAMVFACLLLPRIGPLGNVSVVRSSLEFLAHRQRLPRISQGARSILSWLESGHGAWLGSPLSLILDLAVAAMIFYITLGLVRFILPTSLDLSPEAPWFTRIQVWTLEQIEAFSLRVYLKPDQVKALLAYGVPTLLCYICVTRPFRFGLAVGALLLGATIGAASRESELLLQKRGFFGVLTVRHYKSDDSYSLSHGTTLHGTQVRSDGQQHEPQTYYHKTGPIGQVFEALHNELANQNIGLIGLGSGTLACYGEPGQHLTFYDIDPTVVYIARDSGYFTYLADCRAPYDIELGDARLRMARAADAHYKLIVVDAFSSDAIPIHLITREAIELYFQKLTSDGILAVHISNRHLDLRPVLANVADSLGLACIGRYDKEDRQYPDKSASDWVLLSRKDANFGKLQEDISAYPDDSDDPSDNKNWRRLPINPKVGVWTDDFSNILSVFMW